MIIIKFLKTFVFWLLIFKDQIFQNCQTRNFLLGTFELFFGLSKSFIQFFLAYSRNRFINSEQIHSNIIVVKNLLNKLTLTFCKPLMCNFDKLNESLRFLMKNYSKLLLLLRSNLTLNVFVVPQNCTLLYL